MFGPAHLRWFAKRVAPKTLKRHHYEALVRKNPPEADAMACVPYLRAGDVLDIGANIGSYTKFMSERLGAQGHVHALEPFPETFYYLRHNVRSLRLQNVSCYNVGASSTDGQAHMALAWNKSLGWARIAGSDGTAVRLARLDTLFPQLNPVFIKCDVEGHELEVINGALEMIARCHPVWLIEVSQPETETTMKKLGYISKRLADNQLFVPASLT